MKLRLGVLFLSLATGLFVSCASSGTAAKKADERLANLEPFEIGSMTLGQIKMFSDDVEQKKLDIRLYPRTGQLCLEFFSLPNKQRLYLDRSAREILSAAFLAYKDDFSAKKLLRGTQKSSSAYGKNTIFYQWGVLTYNGESAPAVSLGYRFSGDSPYFTIVIPPTKNKLYATGDSAVKESAENVVYLTTGQIDELLPYLSQENLEGTVKEKLDENPEAKADVY
jgi:hypothetical protein